MYMGNTVEQLVEALLYIPGSISDGFIGISHRHNISGRTTALKST
jgi:hypothetical protein